MRFFETFVALRMLRGIRRQKGFISLSSVFSIAGVAVGVMALIVVIGVMTGFDEDLKTKILSVNPEIIVCPRRGASATTARWRTASRPCPAWIPCSPTSTPR